ncbi:MAG TPA: PIG-L family deacetylase [Vicinamibacterales bacterium]|jgi:LmbE family N-acetylglucosaminyl deacetylase
MRLSLTFSCSAYLRPNWSVKSHRPCLVRSLVPAVTLAFLLFAPALSAAPPQKPKRPPPKRPAAPAPTLTVAPGTRLLVIAPHPDDEVLGAGGLMQRVYEGGGAIRVVYLTDGDGYPEGVQEEDHIESPTADDYRGYGRRRRREARAALTTLGLGTSAYTYTFLSFPDGGLCQLMRTYWSDRRRAYRSPYTRLDRPPASEVLVPSTEYRGEDLTQEIAQIIGDFKPTLIVVPRKEDQHPDHCAAWFFLADALTAVRRVHPDFSTDVINYIVHFYGWPFEDEGPRLTPPPGLRGGTSGWMRFALTPAEARAKRLALRRFETQMHVMDWFLDGFARSSEVFSRPASTRVVLPSRRSPCCDQ